MCLTIPKKVVEIDGSNAVLETMDGNRQAVKSLVELEIGDYVLTQQNIAIEKVSKEDAESMMNLVLNIREGKEDK